MASISHIAQNGSALDGVDHDADGNRTMAHRPGVSFPLPDAVEASFDSANRMVLLNGEALSYNQDGNLTARGAYSYSGMRVRGPGLY